MACSRALRRSSCRTVRISWAIGLGSGEERFSSVWPSRSLDWSPSTVPTTSSKMIAIAALIEANVGLQARLSAYVGFQAGGPFDLRLAAHTEARILVGGNLRGYFRRE